MAKLPKTEPLLFLFPIVDTSISWDKQCMSEMFYLLVLLKDTVPLFLGCLSFSRPCDRAEVKGEESSLSSHERPWRTLDGNMLGLKLNSFKCSSSVILNSTR